MELRTHEPRVLCIFQLDDLHSLACLVLTHKSQPSLIQPLNVSGVDFVAVTVAFVDYGVATGIEGGVGRRGRGETRATQSAHLAPLAPRLEMRRSRTQPHRPSQRILTSLRHEYNSRTLRVWVEFGRSCIGDTAHIPRKLHNSHLHAQTHTPKTGLSSPSHTSSQQSCPPCPLFPKPPGTITPSASLTFLHASCAPFSPPAGVSSSPASAIANSCSRLHVIAACCRACFRCRLLCLRYIPAYISTPFLS